MAIGDYATAAGYPLVPDEGENGKVRHGAREINITRDLVAQVGQRIPENRTDMRKLVGITYGTAAPSGGVDGDIYFRIVE